MQAKAGNLGAVMEILTGTGEEELKELLEKQNQSGETAFYVAAEYAVHDAAAAQGHIEIVNLLLDAGSSLATIAKSNGKTALHSAARNGHVEVVQAMEPGISTRIDQKGQTALHMAVKGQKIEVVEELVVAEPSSVNRKGRAQTIFSIFPTFLPYQTRINPKIILWTVHNFAMSRSLSTLYPKTEIFWGSVKAKGLNNAINSTTVVNCAVLIASVTFAAIYTVPGEYIDDPNEIPPGQYSLGEPNVAPKAPFIIFFVFDSIALFISLADVVAWCKHQS
ncbi:hypothetical protein DKX38_011626 [Salix brachista]|uniref:PGG domain-containing protein n=1 Tax=Salix brachista TaxID=2182728 RepID=A0A5N5LZI7_9ROSI|nr:hypothetical protein DKX38_011626 [Salix brachista]